MKYQKKPIVIEAVRWMGDNWNEIKDFCKEIIDAKDSRTLVIKTLEGNMEANMFDYIVKGIKGEVYPIKPEIFEATYEVIA
jgi:hypothetical protein